MKLTFDGEKPIYVQIAESIEDDILSGNLLEEEQIPSTNQIAQLFQLNPATAGKGVNLLAERGIVYKKRGLGMFVAPGARAALKEARKKTFYETYIVRLLHEAAVLGLSHAELLELLEKGEKEDG